VLTTIESGAFTASDVLDLKQVGFKVAFGAVDYKTNQILQNHTKIEWFVYIDEIKDL
jgi:hypothetical protein